LTILNLGDNALTAIPSAALRHLPSLAELSLADNPLGKMEDSALSSFRALSALDLSSTRLSSVGSFRGLGSLRRLRLANNNLTRVPSAAMRSLGSLETLDVGRNPFISLESGDFDGLKSLKRVMASGCGKLVRVGDRALANLNALEHLDLSQNRALVEVAEDALGSAAALRHLDLSECGLETLDEGLAPWRQLRTLLLRGNPWRCDCDLGFLVKALNDLTTQGGRTANRVTSESQMLPTVDGGDCASPDQFKRRPLTSVDVSEMPCQGDAGDSNRVGHKPQAMGGGEGTLNASRHGGMNVAVVVAVCAVALSFLLLALAVLAYRYWPADACAHRWAKAWRSSVGRGPATAPVSGFKSSVGGLVSGPGTSPFLRPSPGGSGGGDRYQAAYPASAHPQYVSSASSDPEYASGGSGQSCEDEYYYVATWKNRESSGRHIPVTEL